MVKTEKIFKVVMFSPTAHALGKTGNFDGLVNFSLAFFMNVKTLLFTLL